MKDLPINNFTYEGEDYTFVFKNPREGFYRTLIVRTTHIKVILNLTGMSTPELKKFVIDDWFADENEQNRIEANTKRRARVN